MILDIITLGNPILKQKSREITDFSKVAKLEELVDDMIDTMYEANGIGLAAVQIGILKRIFVIDIPEITPKPLVFINPKIVEKSKDLFTYEEGCLSIPEVRGEVSRPRSIKVQFQDLQGKENELLADEIFSICIQHELDHLDGILFIERINQDQKKMVKKELEVFNFSGIEIAQLSYQK